MSVHLLFREPEETRINTVLSWTPRTKTHSPGRLISSILTQTTVLIPLRMALLDALVENDPARPPLVG
jgi:hypothetical protein